MPRWMRTAARLTPPSQWTSKGETLASHPEMNLPPLILASASPRRSELLQQLKVAFRVVPSAAAEVHHDQFTARELARINAYRKARLVAQQHPDALVLGADTLVYLDQQLFGKPTDLDDARRMLG